MILCDVNVYLYAFRRDAENHAQYKSWLERTLTVEPAVGVSEMVLSAIIRIATHPRIFAHPSKMEEAWALLTFFWSNPIPCGSCPVPTI